MQMADTPESKVKALVKALLKKHGAYQFWPVQTGFGSPTLDCLGWHKGRGYGIETKRPRGKPTVRQGVTREDMERADGTVFIIDGVNGELERLEAWLLSPPTN